MAARRYTAAKPPRSVERVLNAAEQLTREDGFHTATMEQIAERAGVSRATLFTRFGSKLGVLEAIYQRCQGSEEIAELVAALALADPVEALDATVAASCRVWERWGAADRHMRAIAVLEPGVRPLLAAQRAFQHDSIHALAARLPLRSALTTERAGTALHMLTSLEAHTELRRELELEPTIQTLTELAHALLVPGSAD
jgi:AcrR family transcriptional regulator